MMMAFVIVIIIFHIHRLLLPAVFLRLCSTFVICMLLLLFLKQFFILSLSLTFIIDLFSLFRRDATREIIYSCCRYCHVYSDEVKTLTWVSIIYHFGMFSFSVLRAYILPLVSNKQLKMYSKQIKLHCL